MELGALSAEQAVRESRSIDYGFLVGNTKEIIAAMARRDPFDVRKNDGDRASGDRNTGAG